MAFLASPKAQGVTWGICLSMADITSLAKAPLRSLGQEHQDNKERKPAGSCTQRAFS